MSCLLKFYSPFCFCMCSFSTRILLAQNVESFISTPALSIPATQTKTDVKAVTVAHSPATINAAWGTYRIRVNITTTKKTYLDISLTSPGGVTRILVTNAGSISTYSDFKDTWFRDDAGVTFATLYADADVPLKNHTAAGWIPQQSIAGFNTGASPNGNWTLTIKNNNGTIGATLNSWEIEFRDTPGGDRTTSVWVTNAETGYPAYDNCATPQKIDKYYNYYGRIKTTYTCNTTTDPTISATAGTAWTDGAGTRHNITLDNTIWFAFKTDAVGGNVDVCISKISRISGAGTGYQATVVDPGAAACVAANWTVVSGTGYGQGSTTSYPSPMIGESTVSYNGLMQCTGLAANKVYYVCVDGSGNSLSSNCTGGTPLSDLDFQVEVMGAVLSNYSVLPIELTSFTAECDKKEVNIKWEVATQTNNDYFTIERAVDGKNFENIGTIKGAGYSSQTMNYSFVDSDPVAEVAYYRLKQTDYNGESEIFSPLYVTCENAIGFSVKANSNQIDDEIIYLTVNGAKNENVFITISDIIGRQVYSKIISENSDSYLTTLNLGQKLTNGMYLIFASMKGRCAKIKIMK